MSKIKKLTDKQIEQALKLFTGWKLTSTNKLQKEFKFDNFKQAFNFMSIVAQKCDQIDHHPDWTNIYNKVKIKLSTHEVEGISQKDLDLILLIEKIIEKK